MEAREKPILGMYEHMRHHLMKWFAERRKKDTDPVNGQIVVTKAFSEINKLTTFQARRYRMIDVSPDNIFEVLSLSSNRTYTVKLDFHTCTCFEWESTGIPCSHAIAAILFNKENPQTYTQAFFSLDGYRKTYANAIFAHDADVADDKPTFDGLYNDKDDEDDEDGGHNNELIPPYVSHQPGRPRKQRIRPGNGGPFAKKRPYKCGRCGKLGYQESTCGSAI